MGAAWAGCGMRALDLFCGAGGASMGLHKAGFEVFGVDIAPQPRYPFKFLQADAMMIPLKGFDLVWASPPCQRFSNAQRLQDNDHPDLLTPIRERLIEAGVNYCIENVPGAPLRNPITLCGMMFGLHLYRHRLFETSFIVEKLAHQPHLFPQVKMGRPAKPGEIIQVVGNFSGMAAAKKAMEINWMNRDELREAIPPVYAQYIGRQARDHIEPFSRDPMGLFMGPTETRSYPG